MEDGTTTLAAERRLERILGRFGGDADGPVVVVSGAIHGNEPAGVRGAERVLRVLEERRPKFRGEVLFLAGNLDAFARGVRFVDDDLNRIWIPERVAHLRAASDARSAEDDQLFELLEIFERLLADAANGGSLRDVVFLDLHTSSAHGCPFMTVGDTLRNRRLAMRFPLPLILGLEEQIDGSLLEYLNNRGVVTLGVEAGQHDAPESIDHVEAVLWCALVETGQLDPADVPDLERFRERLRRAAAGQPPVVEVRHRHAITDSDEFRMKPGFSNFEPVRRDQVVAHDRNGEIRAVEGGRLLLPLYQGQGADGFFLCRDVAPFWLWVSELLRRMRLPALLRFMPGVRAHPERPGVVVVDTRVARWYPLEIFHLLGYRKLRQRGPVLLFERRQHDLSAPPQYAAS